MRLRGTIASAEELLNQKRPTCYVVETSRNSCLAALLPSLTANASAIGPLDSTKMVPVFVTVSVYLLLSFVQLLFEYLPPTFRFLWRRAKEPITTLKNMLTICEVAYREAPWLLREARREVYERLSKHYWHAYERAQDARRKRSRKRRRALTPMGLRTPHQEECVFLSRLPLELRRMVYEMYFGEDHKLLVFPVKRYLWTRMISLPLEPYLAENSRNFDMKLADGIIAGLLNLSLTCKQM